MSSVSDILLILWIMKVPLTYDDYKQVQNANHPFSFFNGCIAAGRLQKCLGVRLQFLEIWFSKNGGKWSRFG